MWFYKLMVGEVGIAEHLGEQLHEPEVAIIDDGSQLTDVIYWAVVEAGVRAEIVPFTEGSEPLDFNGIKSRHKAVIFSGSDKSVNDEGGQQIPPEWLDGSVPVLGICWGAQEITRSLGGRVSKLEVDEVHLGEYGQTVIDTNPVSVLFRGLLHINVLMSHGDSILRLPQGFRATAQSDNKVIASFESPDGRIIGTQFHPEVEETEHGLEMIAAFLKEVASIESDPEYTVLAALNEYMEKQEAEIAEILEHGDMIVGFLSGGVDSMTAASAVMKVARALDRVDRVKFYYVDNGHVRVEDDDLIERMQAQGMPVEKIEAAHEFFHTRLEVKLKNKQESQMAGPLVEESDPAIKRAIMGAVFKKIARQLIGDLGDQTGKKVWLMQGTNSSDIVESGGSGGDQIKDHHNVGAMDDMRKARELFEPLSSLLKSHIRLLAEHRYGLPDEFAFRQPFPGPGTSPRIVVNPRGELDPIDPALQAQVDRTTERIAGRGLRAHVVGLKTVGQKGDSRSFANSVFIEGNPNWRILSALGKELIDRSPDLNRAFYMPGVEIGRSMIRGTLTADNEAFAHQLRFMEEVHRDAMVRTGLDPYLSQHFVGTFGADFTGQGMPTLGLRLFITGNDSDKMAIRRRGSGRETLRTGVAARPGLHINESAFSGLVRILKGSLRYHSSLAYDITDKPSGTVEWE